MRIQREISITWDREIIHRECVERFGCLYLCGDCTCASEFGETVRDVEYEDDQRPIRGPFDLEVAEERIGTEEV